MLFWKRTLIQESRNLDSVLTPKELCILYLLGLDCLISGSLLLFIYRESMNLKYSIIHLQIQHIQSIMKCKCGASSVFAF